MIKLRQLFESSARDRLKKRVKSVDAENFNDKQLAPFINRIAKVHKLNPHVFEDRYIRFYSRCVLGTPGRRSDYFTEVVVLFAVINVGGGYSYFNFPHNGDQILDRVEVELKKLVKSMDIPEKFDLKTVAILLRFLEDNGFKLHGI